MKGRKKARGKGLTLFVVILMALGMVACGRESGAGDAVTEDAAVEGQQEEKPQDGTEDRQDDEGSGAEALFQYAAGLEICDLSGTQLIYEEKESDGYSYFMTKGLKGLSEKEKGCLDTAILDLDEDGKEELLAFYLEEGDEAHRIKAVVYEYRDGQVVKGDAWTFLNYAIGTQCDGAEIRFMIKDGKYICMDSWQYTFVSADGVSIDLSACFYDGTEFVETAEFGFGGSDYSEMGKEETEFVEKLRLMGFDKTATAVYDRDMFHFYAADEGVEPLFRISLINSSATGETSWEEMPTAVIRQMNAGTLEEEFMLPESNSRILEAEELSGMVKVELRIARNEIYARYGWQFESEELADYFEGKAWYAAGENVDDTVLSEVERANIALIAEMEEKAPGAGEIPLASDMDIEGGTALTASELADMSGFLQAIDSYGFLQSFYRDVRDVDLGLVLYCGAGIVDREFSESMRESYLKTVGKTEFDTDFTALREADIDALLKKKTGYGLSDMSAPFYWIYLEEEKAYCMEAGDTNYMAVSVIDGMKTDDGMYYILYENPMLEYTGGDTVCMVTLKKQGNEYQFVANERQ